MSDLSRVEQLLRNALGEDIYEVTPQSRVEILLAQLNELIEGISASVDPEELTPIITAWLAENIHDGAVVDTSLSVAGAAAESKKTGDEISQLKEELTASQIVSNVDLTNYTQGYIIASTGAISTNSDLGRVDGIVLRKGSKISLTARGYSTNIAMIYRCNSDGTYTCLVASDSNSVKTYEYTATENMTVGVSFYINDTRIATVMLAVSDALNTVTPKYSYLTVGTGKQYTDIKSAINAVTNPSASNRYVIYVYEGQYNTYGSSQLSSSYKGLILPDYTDIIGIGNRDNIVLYFRGTTETSSYNNNISTLNVGGHNTIENITIIGKHCRYAVHDDFLATGETEQTYKNVKFLVEAADSSSMASASTNVPYGCGAEIQKKLVFKNCIFENGNNYANFFYHDVTAASMIMGAVISFVNCRFVSGRYSIQLTKYNTPKESRIYLYGCKADNGGFIRGDGTTVNTMYISGFASQGFTFTGNGTISQEDIDACIDLI